MSITVCVFAKTLDVLDLGGHLWAYLNWSLGLRSLGCQVIWMEAVGLETPASEVQARVAELKNQLKPYGLAEDIALCSWNGQPLSRDVTKGCLDIEVATEADLLLNMGYGIPTEIARRFRRSALLDIDPGLTQIWISEGQMDVAQHDLYFTIGETVGRPEASFPDCGLRWNHTPPAVFLPAWPTVRSHPGAPYTTVTNWWGEWLELQGQTYSNGKRDGFLPFLELPKLTCLPLELTVCLGAGDDGEREMLLKQGWRVHNALSVASTVSDYRHYIQNSRGEFSCAKPSCTRLQNAWISDRTICYLASGKPAVVQHTGASRFLPDSEGLFRFRTVEEAARALATAESDYDRHCRSARALAEEYFDAAKVIARVLEKALE